MTKTSSIIFKSIILTFGLIVIFVAYLMFGSPPPISGRETYLWTNIVLIYLAIMLPTFLYTLRKDNIDRRMLPTMFIWFGVFAYLGVGSLLIVLVMMSVLLIKIAMIIQMVLAFAFAIMLYVVFFAGSFIANVGIKEKHSLHRVTLIKDKARFLKKQYASDGTEKNKALSRLMENLIFLSPVDKSEAYSLEEEILAQLDGMELALEKDGADCESYIKKITSLYQKRRLILA